jgi:hypothetical protein
MTPEEIERVDAAWQWWLSVLTPGLILKPNPSPRSRS